jgi:hypothetical protein
MKHLGIFALLVSLAAVACGDETPPGTSGSGGGGGETSTTSAAATSGSGGAPACPSICAQFQALYDAAGCTLDECNCKEVCVDAHQAAIDCLDQGTSVCACNASGELDCDSTCDAENMAANACFSAN